MIEIYKKIAVPAFVWGIIGGLLMIIQLYIRIVFNVSGEVIFVTNSVATIGVMIAGVFVYRKREVQIAFTTARELSFLIYLVEISVLLIYRLTSGYFDNFSSLAILFGILFMSLFGRIISYFVGINMYNLRPNK